MRSLLVVLALVLTVTGCGDSGGPGGDAGDLSGSWQLVEGRGVGGAVPILDSHPITLTFEDGRAGGTAACNQYGAELARDGSNVRFTEIVQTEMACEPLAAMEAERTYLEALAQVTAFALDGDRLILTGANVELAYEPTAG